MVRTVLVVLVLAVVLPGLGACTHGSFGNQPLWGPPTSDGGGAGGGGGGGGM